HPFGSSTVKTGSLSGNAFSITITVDAGEGANDYTFSGTLEGDAIKGSINGPDFSAEFTGTRPSGASRERSGETRSQGDDHE
ncbi:MAG TPA: hypothetical protein VEC95_02000, partial [Terriglobales bacterium]|nr:hypothetical protein [Terriglobales bacterium]